MPRSGAAAVRERSRRGAPSASASLRAPFAFLALLALGALFAWHVYASGWILYYGDAEAHLESARRLFDSRTPGYEQLGVPWLPLPHLLMLPLTRDAFLWRTGLAGTIPGVICFAVAGAFLFAAVRLMFGRTAPAWCAVALFGLNPNVLYLSSTPMTEPVLFASLMGVLYFTVLFGRTQSLWAAAGAGIFSMLSTLTRYDGWFLLPFVAVYIAVAGGQKRWNAAILYCLLAGLGPVYWFAHNWIFEGDPLAFYRGPSSARAIQGDAYYPGKHNWTTAVRYYYEAVELCGGIALVGIGAAGVAAALWKRAWWPVTMLVLIPSFYVISMYSSGNPIFVPTLWPNSYYNTRYGLGGLPLLAVGGAALVAVLPERFGKAAALALVAIAVVPWLAYPRPDNWITWRESKVNSDARRAWTAQVASYLKHEYRRGSGVLFSWGDLTGAFREAGIPLRETLNVCNGPAFEAAIARPELALFEEHVIAISADRVAQALIQRDLRKYHRVHTVYVKGGPVIEIHRRTYDNSVLQGARRAQ